MKRLLSYPFLLVSIVFLFNSLDTKGQGAQKVFNPIYQEYFDSLKAMDYPYNMPLLGKKAAKAGYDLPYAYGLSAIFFSQRQEISIESIQLGFNDSPMADFSQFIQFGPTIAASNALTVRPDIWVLPFLNVYGIFGGGTTQTDVTLISPFGFQTTQRFDAKSFGIGGTLTGAFGPIWVAWDNNYNFVDVDAVVEPIPAFNSSIRFGHTIPSFQNPERNLSVWVGSFYQVIKNDTDGAISVADVFPGFGEGNVIQVLRDWAAGLPPAQKVIANQIIDKLEDVSSGIDPENSQIRYQLDKKVTAPFNMLLGAQYQINKNWMIRTEMGVFGKRNQFLLNLNWRFPGFKKAS